MSLHGREQHSYHTTSRGTVTQFIVVKFFVLCLACVAIFIVLAYHNNNFVYYYKLIFFL